MILPDVNVLVHAHHEDMLNRPDAYLAALAIESGSEWITTDQDLRFSGLSWRHPLDG